MTRKLMALNLALLAALGALFFDVRREWREARARERVFLAKQVRPVSGQALAPLARPQALTAAAYAPVAEKNLFSKDRNANVILDPVAPPPPKPLPPFPAARGVMLWDGVPPTVVLSEKPGGQQHLCHPGDPIGPWHVVSVDSQYVVLEWDGKEYRKRLDELLDKTPIAVAEAQPPPSTPAAAPAAASTTPKAQQLSKPSGPGGVFGVDVGANIKTCVEGDTSPAGTVVEGMKKLISKSPFGTACRWEPVQ